MIALLQIAITRSADDLSADLRACRQLRHLSPGQIEALVALSFDALRPTHRFVRVSDAFERAFAAHGYSCDTCDAVTDCDPKRLRYAADRALATLDGQVKLLLCGKCSDRFRMFCNRVFDRDPHIPHCNELEQMMIAWIASELLRETRRLERAA